MARTSISSASIRLDTSQLKGLARDLRAAQPILSKVFQDRMRAAGGIVAEEAKRRSSWSSRIPGSIRVSVTGFGTSVKVTAGGAKAPDAAPYEHGGVGGTFRHPVFGRDTWVSQQARPYLGPALDAKAEELTAAVAECVEQTFGQIGFR